jgi:23S rRNA (guanine745-N1)-methyltransferase
MLTCPVCGESLEREERVLRCPHRHAFDVAREGYVNLLVGRVGGTGDTKEMLRARRHVLERGYYAPVADAINALVLDESGAGDGREAVLDAGCGEGYYIGRLRERAGGVVRCFGLDVAKEGVRLAAKRYLGVSFVVGDVARLPFAPASLRALLNIFAPRDTGEFTRVVALGGLLVTAIPEPSHLTELRQRFGLLGIEADKERHVIEQFQEGFTLAQASTVAYRVAMGAEDVRNLLLMTPNAWHRAQQGWERLDAGMTLSTTIAIRVLAFRRGAGAASDRG